MKSFRHPVTNILTAWGYVESNGDDLARGEPHDFNLEPGKWQWDGVQWVPAQPTTDEIIKSLTATVQCNLDTKAQERSYDSILSACTYATSTNPKFAAEGQACVEWRDAVWSACYAHMDKVLAGDAPVPTEGELIALLPVFTWPEG